MLWKRVSMILLAAFVTLVGYSSMLGLATAEAGSFELLSDSGRLYDMKNNEKWERVFRSADGDIKIRFRRVHKLSDFFGKKHNKPYHLMIWRKDVRKAEFDDKEDRIFDWDLRPNRAGYRFQVFRDTKTNKIFIAFDAVGRVQLLGYDKAATNGLRTFKKYTGKGVLQKYVDSANFYTTLPYPEVVVTKNHDLQLKFDNLYSNANMPYQYNLFWSVPKNWLGWADVTNYPKPEMREATAAWSSIGGSSVGESRVYESEIPEDEEIWIEE